jgi:flagellar motor switch protein FliM
VADEGERPTTAADGPGAGTVTAGAAATGGEEARAPTPARDRQVRPLDFSQPTKFTPEVRRRLGAWLGSACGELAERLCEELNCEVHLEVAEIEQHTWASAKARLAADGFAVAVLAGAAERQMLLSVEPALILQVLECMLGGEAAQAPAERHLSDVDWALARDLLDKVVAELSSAWAELGGSELRRGEIDLEGDAGLVTGASEPTLALSVASSVGGCEASMSLLIPWPCVEPLLDELRGAPVAAETLPGQGEHEIGRGLTAAQVLLRAEVGSVQMPIERMLEIVPGALVELGQRAEDGVRLFAEEVSLGWGRPGRSGTRRAIKLLLTGEPPTRSETYAQLGRADLERARAHAQGATGDGAAGGSGGGAAGGERVGGDPILRSIFVRVWAELGRTHMSLGDALELTTGTVVELDQAAAAPVELFANGLCFANGSLVVTPEGTWAVQVEALV